MSRISTKREAIYNRLSSLVGNTSLYEIININIPNDCRIFCKAENENPTGSHYDRFWVDYLRKFEEEEGIQENFPIVETSTGNSGASFAWVCRALGYTDYRVVIPEDMPFARKAQIKSYGAIIHESPKKLYVKGLIDEFKVYLKSLKSDKKTKQMIPAPNHAIYGEKSISTMENIAHEMIAQLRERNIEKVDYLFQPLAMD